jgi:hypothetical protein
VVWCQRVTADGTPEPIAAAAYLDGKRLAVGADGASHPAPLPAGAWSAELRFARRAR